MTDEQYHSVPFSVKGLLRMIKEDRLTPDMVIIDGKPAQTKEQAVKSLERCLEKGITVL